MKLILAVAVSLLILFSGCINAPTKPIYRCPSTGCEPDIVARLTSCESAIFYREGTSSTTKVEQTNKGSSCFMSWSVDKSNNPDLVGLSMECDVPMDVVKAQANLTIENLNVYCTGSLKDFFLDMQPNNGEEANPEPIGAATNYQGPLEIPEQKVIYEDIEADKETGETKKTIMTFYYKDGEIRFDSLADGESSRVWLLNDYTVSCKKNGQDPENCAKLYRVPLNYAGVPYAFTVLDLNAYLELFGEPKLTSLQSRVIAGVTGNCLKAIIEFGNELNSVHEYCKDSAGILLYIKPDEKSFENVTLERTATSVERTVSAADMIPPGY